MSHHHSALATGRADNSRESAMTYLHCPRCRLAIKCRSHYLMMTNCPRCLARAAIPCALFASPLDAIELHATSRPLTAGAAPVAGTAGAEGMPSMTLGDRR